MIERLLSAIDGASIYDAITFVMCLAIIIVLTISIFFDGGPRNGRRR